VNIFGLNLALGQMFCKEEDKLLQILQYGGASGKKAPNAEFNNCCFAITYALPMFGCKIMKMLG
jgi:hypothetical protein